MRLGFLLAALLCLAAGRASADSVFIWSQGLPPIVLGPSNASFCVLTRITGRFHGLGENVKLDNKFGTTWELSGSSQQIDVGATARCFPVAAFSAPGPARWVSFHFPDADEGPGPGGCLQITSNAWWGDAATAISTMSGNFRGGGEFIQVRQSPDPNKSSSYLNQTCRDPPQMYAEVTSFFAGKPQSGKLVTFAGPGGARGTLATIPEITAGSNQTVALARIADGMCYFTRVSGAFNGGGESVEIKPQGDHWVLATTSHSGDGVWAAARCMAFKQ